MLLFVAWQLYSGIQIHLVKRKITDDKNMICTKLSGISIPGRKTALDSERAGLEKFSDRVRERQYILNSEKMKIKHLFHFHCFLNILTILAPHFTDRTKLALDCIAS